MDELKYYAMPDPDEPDPVTDPEPEPDPEPLPPVTDPTQPGGDRSVL